MADQLEALGTAVDTSVDALKALGYELADTTGTEAADLFVFAGEELNITGFALEGNDTLFIGEGFTVVTGAADVASTRQGDASVLELFFQQEGNAAVIYVEETSFAGNGLISNDLVKITLQGVNVNDLVFENGFISIAA